jgi:hypothetical protein
MMETNLFSSIKKVLFSQVHIAPLVMFRVIFGAMMFLGIVRFAWNGWIYDLYIKPQFFFTYYGFEWVKPLGDPGMYVLFVVMALAALCMMLGFFYKVAAALFFMSFTYVELIDKSTYLNHYYFISIVAFLMILVPAGRYFSLDVKRNGKKEITHIPRLFIVIIQLQLGIVYFFAGVAKLNYHWLFEAMPLRMWLPPHTNLPVVGFLMDKLWIAYFFSWFGAIYDLSIPFLLVFKKTRGIAYFLVIAFHLMTSMLFNIGMFPYIMILCTLVFFSEDFHLNLINRIRKLFSKNTYSKAEEKMYQYNFIPVWKKILVSFLLIHFTIQLLMPFRYALYPGKLFWNEEGFRFSWRVMLMEKAGKVFFHVTDPDTGRHGEAMMDNVLTPFQEKMMSTQPDMILQFAHYLKKKYQAQGIPNPKITAEAYVTLNGSGSRLFLDSTVDLTKEHDSFKHKAWILPFNQ